MNIIQKIIFLLVLSSLLLTSFAVALTNQVAPSLQGNQFGFNPTTANYNVQEAAFVVLKAHSLDNVDSIEVTLNYDPQKIVVLAEEVASRLDGWNTLSLTIEDGKIDYVAAPNPQAVPLSGEFEVLFIPFTVNPGVSTPIVFTLDNELSGIVSNNDYVVLQDPINSRFTIVQAEPEPEPEVDPIPEAELELEVEPEPEPEVEPVPQAICGDGIVTGDETCVSCPADAGCEGLLECNLLSEQCEEPATDELPLDNPTVEYINSLREIFVSDSSTLSKMSATAGRTICYMNNDCDLGVGQVELSEDEKLEQMLVVFSETLTRNQPRDLTIESIGSIAQDVRCYFDDLCQFAQE